MYSTGGGELNLIARQGMRLALGFGMTGIGVGASETLKRWTPWLYGVGLVLLLAIMVAGNVSKGAQPWLDLGVVRFQPAEVNKLVVPMMLV